MESFAHGFELVGIFAFRVSSHPAKGGFLFLKGGEGGVPVTCKVEFGNQPTVGDVTNVVE